MWRESIEVHGAGCLPVNKMFVIPVGDRKG